MQHTGGVYRFLAVASADAQQPTPTLSPDELKRHQAELQRKEEELRRREEELRRVQADRLAGAHQLRLHAAPEAP